MSQITDITPQVKDKMRCNVYLDGRFCCGLKLETVMKNRLKIGQAITGAELSAIQSESEKSEALDKALNYISASMKTRTDVEKYLAKKGYLQEVISFVVEKMNGYGYIDDGQYGENYAKSLSSSQGKRMIQLKLRKKGLSEEDIDRALSVVDNEGDTAKKILEKYMKNKECNKDNLYKAFRHLLSKGFDYETAKNAMQEWGAEDEDLSL